MKMNNIKIKGPIIKLRWHLHQKVKILTNKSQLSFKMAMIAFRLSIIQK